MAAPYDPSWRSLRQHPTPQWFRDAKFGIYTHWGVYAVPAFGPNGTWYPYLIYQDGSEQQHHHLATYGSLREFGYKDFIPRFTGHRFDPDEWAALFKAAGARFAGPVGEHHDGFSMWATAHSAWHAGRLGPKRDVVAELERSIRAAGMRYLVALHHAEWWWFYPHWRRDFDTGADDACGLYGERHNLEWAAGSAGGGAPGGNAPGGQPTAPAPPSPGRMRPEWWRQDPPSKAFLDQWLAKIKEVIDRFTPDLLWFDFGINWVQEHYVREFLAYYYNRALEGQREVVVTYKWHHLVPGSAVVDLELGRFDELTYHDWITDTSVDDQGAWSYVADAKFKTPTAIVHNLVDNVSKNGYLLLNVGPRPDGTIPEPAQEVLRAVGRWLETNGEAIYDTTPWKVYGEGPTTLTAAGPFSERREVHYTGRDVRYTAKGEALYAICLGWPGDRVDLTAVAEYLYPGEVTGVTLLGSGAPLTFQQTRTALRIHLPRRSTLPPTRWCSRSPAPTPINKRVIDRDSITKYYLLLARRRSAWRGIPA